MFAKEDFHYAIDHISHAQKLTRRHVDPHLYAALLEDFDRLIRDLWVLANEGPNQPTKKDN